MIEQIKFSIENSIYQFIDSFNSINQATAVSCRKQFYASQRHEHFAVLVIAFNWFLILGFYDMWINASNLITFNILLSLFSIILGIDMHLVRSVWKKYSWP